MMYEPTNEQKDIIEAVGTGENILVSAFAGTGKTSTLQFISEKYPQKNFLYLAYNKSLQKEGEKKFKPNVRCLTVHSLAYRNVGYLYKRKLHIKIYSRELAQKFNVAPIKRNENNFNCYASPSSIAACARDAINRFCYSISEKIEPHHINLHYLIKFEDDYQLNKYSIDNIHNPTNFLEQYLCSVFKLAKLLWKEMINEDNNEVPMTHEGYLKLWQLSKPKIPNYDCIMLDEAQDANPPILDILNNQRCQRIYVGDTNQQIYGWRGSVNAMNQLKGKHLYITKSFRFGQEIAIIANRILKRLNERKTLIGNSAITTEIGKIDKSRPYTIICRTNGGIFDQTLNLAAQKKKIHILGGLKTPVDLFESAYYLWKGEVNNVKTSHIRLFNTWERLSEEAKLTGDSELTSLVNFISNHGEKTLEILNIIKVSAGYKEEHADIVLTTGHKSKGREWPQVIIHDDFPSLDKAHGQEINLLYVSATRAEKRLQSMVAIDSCVEKNNPSLTIELVPETCWFSNVRSNVSTQDWERLKRITAKRAGYKCEICSQTGTKWPVECHEIWNYCDKNKVQTLSGLIVPRQLLLPVDDNYDCRSPIIFFRPSPPQFAYF